MGAVLPHGLEADCDWLRVFLGYRCKVGIFVGSS